MNEQSQKPNEESNWKKEAEAFVEETVFKLDENEVEKCRYMITDPQRGTAECYVHRYRATHGVTLFPKHLWDLRKGVLYFKKDRDSEWERYKPDFEKNIQRTIINH